MRSRTNPLATAVAALLVLALFGVYWTGSNRWRAPARIATISADDAPALDQSSLLAVQSLLRAPTTSDEVRFAEQALRIADVDMDLAFAAAVRDAVAHPKPLTRRAKAVADRLAAALAEQAVDSSVLTQLTERVKAGGAADDQLALARTRLELDHDEVDDAREDLVHAGGDPQGRMEALIHEHEETSRNSDSTRIVVTASTSIDGLLEATRVFSSLREKDLQIQEAMTSADSAAKALSAEHDKLDSVERRPSAPGTSLLVDTQRRALEQKARITAEKRGDNQRRLVGVYARWLRVVHRQERAVINGALQDLAWVLLIALLWMFSDSMILRLLARSTWDRRSVQRLRVVARVSLQALGVLLILIILFGTPSNLGTIIGLAGAGLTVALKDFIVSFVGWLVLMGKDGLRLGDLVEINGVTGEVVELGMFNTVLHETGNWTDAGHPTGRRVTFTNSYAIEGHYFNFSTSGQWLWDEVRIAVPAGKDPFPVVEALQSHVQEATAESARLAELEWKGTVRAPGSQTITAAPAITIKPVMGGVELTLRYITHAADRYQVRATLYRAAVSVLGGTGEAHLPAAAKLEPQRK